MGVSYDAEDRWAAPRQTRTTTYDGFMGSTGDKYMTRSVDTMAQAAESPTYNKDGNFTYNVDRLQQLRGLDPLTQSQKNYLWDSELADREQAWYNANLWHQGGASPYPDFGNGGGGGGLSQAQIDAAMGAIGNWRPDQYSFSAAPRNTAHFDQLAADLARRKAAALAGVDKSTQYILQVLAGMKNPYAADNLRTNTPMLAQTTSPLLNARSQGMVNRDIVDPLNNQSQIFDDGLLRTLNMLSGAWDESMQSRNLETDLNDYYYRNKAESEAGAMNTGISMANAADQAAYDRYVAQEQQRVAEANTTATNQARSGAINTFLGLIGGMPNVDPATVEALFK